jgi:PAS domain S-box-containing protein
VLLNVQAEKQFGYRRDELVGQKVKNIIPEGFAERLIADALRTPRLKTRWRSRSAPGLSSPGGGRMEAIFRSRSC